MTHTSLEPLETRIDSIWYTRCPVPTISGVAQHYKWLQASFRQLGVELASLRGAAETELRASHFQHTLSNQFREGGNIPAIWARSLGQDTAVIALTWVEETQVILTRKDSRLRTAEDLRNTRIGLPRYASKQIDFERAQALHGFNHVLTHHGLTLDDVRVVDIVNNPIDLDESGAHGHPARNEIQALVNGDVDAIYLKGAVAAAQQQQHGLRVLFDLRSTGIPELHVNNGTPRTLTVSRRLIRERPDLVIRYLAVLLQASEWAAENAAQTRDAIASETSSTPELVLQAYGPSLHERLRPSINPRLISRLNQQKNFLLSHGYLGIDFKIEDWVDTSIYPEALALSQTLPPLYSTTSHGTTVP